jgi:hypothetical protein
MLKHGRVGHARSFAARAIVTIPRLNGTRQSKEEKIRMRLAVPS